MIASLLSLTGFATAAAFLLAMFAAWRRTA
jgi:hypothetical protein